MFSGCKQPTETIYVEVPVEAPEKPPEGGEEPEITGFTFTQAYPLRAAYAVKGKTAGRISNPVGGTAPFAYTLVSGDGSNDTDNRRFMVSGDLLQIQADTLAVDVYFICLKVTDSKGIHYSQATTVTVHPDPVALDQETRTAQGVNFKMRYVPSGAFVKPDPWGAASIPTGFWMGETEVTQEIYLAVMGENPSQFKDNPVPGETQSSRPVDSVSWYEAVRFCNRLSVVSGREPAYKVWGVDDTDSYLKWAFSTQSSTAMSNIYVDENASGYRLPSRDEWFWAAIGADIQNPGQVNTTGVKKHYSGGPVGNGAGIENFAWCYFNSSDITHEVGKKLSNELGLFDMSGNIAEWSWERAFYGSFWPMTESSPIFHLLFNAATNPYGRLEYCGIRIVSNQ
jgi:formylglycine-generating enzyme required for sulfatase activity